MATPPRVVVLCPRRVGRPDRDRLWSFARAHWAKILPGVPIIEGHHHPDEGPFSRSAALNRAAELAGAWDVAILIDADVLLDPHAVRDAVERALETGGPVLAYHERGQLTAAGTQKILDGYRGNWRPLVKLRSNYGGFLYDACSSAVVVTRELWDAVGGFDEVFAGWGWEDVAFRIACETTSGLELHKIHATAWHLWHRVSGGNNPEEPTFIANRERGDAYKAVRGNPEGIAPLLAEAAEVRAARQQSDALAASMATASGGERIPRILHRTVPAETSPDVEAWWDRFGELHPGWELRTHRDPMDPAEWETGDLWDLCHSGAQRAGLIRLEALYRWGGVYVDSDVEPFRPLDSLLGLPAFAAWEDRKVVPDAVLGSEPGHPAFALMLEQARAAITAGALAWDSGPGVTTSVLPGRADVLLLPPGSFYPYHYTRKDLADVDHATEQPWAFGAHHWHHSWAGK